MSRNTKIALGVVGGLALLCICVCVIAFAGTSYFGATMAQSITTETEDVAAIGAGIADYDIPSGYAEQMGMSFFIFDMVGITPTSGQTPMIMLMQFPDWMSGNQAQMQEQIQQQLQQQTGSGNISFTIIEEKTTVIRDQEVILTIQEGTDSSGQTIRQAFAIFQGKGGPTVLMAMGEVERWDQTALDSFIDSIR